MEDDNLVYVHPCDREEKDVSFLQKCMNRNMQPIKILKFAIARHERIRGVNDALRKVEKYLPPKAHEFAYEKIQIEATKINEDVHEAWDYARGMFPTK